MSDLDPAQHDCIPTGMTWALAAFPAVVLGAALITLFTSFKEDAAVVVAVSSSALIIAMVITFVRDTRYHRKEGKRS